VKKKYFSILFLFLLGVAPAMAQTTEGKEFWVTFGSIWGWTLQPSSSIQIRVVSSHTPTTGVIYFTNLNDSVTFSMGAYETYTYPLNQEQQQAVYNLYMGITDYSIHITSHEPVSVYAFNMLAIVCDVTNILPVTALGREYYHISYTPLSAWYLMSDAYAVVATQNNTGLFHNGDSVATLHAGQVYYRTAELETDMTGAHITATHPVAFFALHQTAQIPCNTPLGSPSHLAQQLAPVNTWGKEFFVPASKSFPDIVRIVASQNGTNIETDGTMRLGVPGAKESFTNLQAGDFVELEIFDTGCYIKTDKPVGVCSYLRNFQYGFTSPAQCWIPAIKQTVPYIQAAPFKSTVSNNYLLVHYALVCTPTHAKENTTVSIGGAPSTTITDGWTDNATAKMSFCSIPLENDTSSYTFTNPAGLIVLCSGFKSLNASASSYYYLAGSAMRRLDTAFYVNNVHYENLQDATFCDKNVHFRAEIADYSEIKWFIDGSEYIPAHNLLEWNKEFATGVYSIQMWVRYENNEEIFIPAQPITLKMEIFWVKIRNVRY